MKWIFLTLFLSIGLEKIDANNFPTMPTGIVNPLGAQVANPFGWNWAYGPLTNNQANNQAVNNNANNNQQTTTNSTMPKKALIIIATRTESVEIVAPVDTLRRMGVEVTVASVYGREPVSLCERITIVPDIALSEVVDKDAYDVVIVPGWLGYRDLANSQLVGEIVRNQYNKGKLVASICLGAHVLLAHKIALGSKITTWPFILDEVPPLENIKSNYQYLEEAVVKDKNLISSRGPATVYAFTFAIAENLLGVDAARAAARLNVFQTYPIRQN